MDISNYRIVFPKGKQRRFIEQIEIKSHLPIKDLAKLGGIHERTLRDWRREKFLASYEVLNVLAKRAGLTIPKNVKKREFFWYTIAGGIAGHKAVMKKYGQIPTNPEYQKKKWREWWEEKGKFSKHQLEFSRSLLFHKPKHSEDLAEFIGAMLGDGGMSTYQLKITLHHIDDLAYSKYIFQLIRKLFKVRPKIYHRPKNSINDITVSRTGLVGYLKSEGLVVGNKIRQQIDIPEWIKSNPKFSVACVRGLIDTDGCIFRHRYKVNGKWYMYKKIAFTSKSPALRISVFDILKELKMNPRMAQDQDVRLDSKKDVNNYFMLIGSHNPKHLNKYRAVI